MKTLAVNKEGNCKKSGEMEYRMMNSDDTRLLPYFTRLLSQSLSNINGTTF